MFGVVARGITVLVLLAGSMGAAGTSARTARPASGPGPALAGPDVAVPHHEPGTFDFDAGWRFALVNAAAATDPTGAYANAPDPAFDDSAWRAVHLPHDWSVEL